MASIPYGFINCMVEDDEVHVEENEEHDHKSQPKAQSNSSASEATPT